MISCLAEMTGAADVEIMFFFAHFQLIIVSVRIVKNMRKNFVEEDINILLNSICFIPDLIHPSQVLSFICRLHASFFSNLSLLSY